MTKSWHGMSLQQLLGRAWHSFSYHTRVNLNKMLAETGNTLESPVTSFFSLFVCLGFFYLFILTLTEVCVNRASQTCKSLTFVLPAQTVMSMVPQRWRQRQPQQVPQYTLSWACSVPRELPAWADAEGPTSNGLTRTSAAVTTWQYYSSSCSLLRCISLNNKNSPKRKAPPPPCPEFSSWISSPLGFPQQPRWQQRQCSGGPARGHHLVTPGKRELLKPDSLQKRWIQNCCLGELDGTVS